MEQASAAAAQAGGAGDEAGSTSDSAAGQAARSAFLPIEPAVLAEMQEAAAVQPVQSLIQAAAPTTLLAGAPSEFAAPAGMRSTEESSAVRQTSAAPASPVGIQPAANSAPVATPPSIGGSPDLEGPPPATVEGPPSLGPIIDPIVEVVGDVVDDIVQVLDPVLEEVEQVVAPVLGIVGDVVGDVVQVLDPVVEQVVAPVVGIVGDVVGDVVQVLDPVIEQVAVPVADILGGPLAPLLGLGSGGGAPIVVASVVAFSGSIDFEAGPAAGSLPLDDLFSGGGYSDYNLTLQADVSVSSNPAPGGILPDVDIAAELNALIGNTSSEGGPNGQGNAHHIGLPSLLGDTGLHWLGI